MRLGLLLPVLLALLLVPAAVLALDGSTTPFAAGGPGEAALWADVEAMLSLGERRVESAALAKVRRRLMDRLQSAGAEIETEEFAMETPFGERAFQNVVARLVPARHAERRFVVSAHMDTKHYEDFEFVGALDSAVSVIIILHVAELLLRDVRERVDPDGDALQLLGLDVAFLDGEEAFVEWTPEDSVYGARFQAGRWAEEMEDNMSSRLENVEAFVLLDLLGGFGPTSVRSSHADTDAHFNRLLHVQKRIAPDLNVFQPGRGYPVQDDHVPFMDRGVPIVHLIPVPFPKVWHTEHDDLDAVDRTVVAKLADVIYVWLKEEMWRAGATDE